MKKLLINNKEEFDAAIAQIRAGADDTEFEEEEYPSNYPCVLVHDRTYYSNSSGWYENVLFVYPSDFA